MFGKINEEEKFRKIGEALDKAMSDINTIVQNPMSIKDVKYTTDEDEPGVFNSQSKFLRLEIIFDDSDGRFKAAKKNALVQAEDELMRELDKIKMEKEKYG